MHVLGFLYLVGEDALIRLRLDVPEWGGIQGRRHPVRGERGEVVVGQGTL